MNTALDRNDRLALALLCLLAAAVRLGLYAAYPGVVHPDETFQYLEQAHRLVDGTGLVPWEYQVGIRSWLFAGLLAGVLALARAFSTEPLLALWLVAVLMVLIALPTIAVAFLWGRRIQGRVGGLLAGGVLAVWFETAYFTAHPLMDAIGAGLLVPGLYLADSFAPTQQRKRLFWAGALLAFAVLLRPQLAPAAPLTALWVCRLELRRRWLPLLIGAAISIVLLATFDWVTLGLPLQSVWLYAWDNIHQHVASDFGEMPWYFYVGGEKDAWGYAAPLVLAAAALGSWRRPFIAANAAILLLAVSLIGHKEMRYDLSALTLGLILAGLGSAVALAACRRHLAPRLSDTRLGLAGLFVWAAISATIAPLTYASTLRNGVTMQQAMRRISADPAACGLAITPRSEYWRTGGYTHLRPGILLYSLEPGAMPPTPAGYDRILAIAPRGGPQPDYAQAGFTEEFCVAENDRGPRYRASELRACVWRRPGPCTPGQPTLTIPSDALVNRLR